MSNARGCGAARTEGGVYLESGLSPFGQPLESFLMDPPLPWVGERLPRLGVKMMLVEQIWHIVDVVGEKAYPSPADYLEEGRRLGFSRKVNPKLDFQCLTPGASRIITLHPKAILTSIERHANQELGNFFESMDEGSPANNPKMHFCPHLKATGDDDSHVHQDNFMCLGLHWMLWESTEPNYSGPKTGGRRVASTVYDVVKPHARLVNPEWKVGIIASLPITNIAVIKARDNSHIETANNILKMRTKIEVSIEDE